MQPIDIPVLRDRLSELAEVYERRPVTEKALKVWFDTLREFPTERVAGVFIGWPKTHNKFPTPSDAWKVCNEMGIEEREAKARAEARINARRDIDMGPSENAQKVIAGIRDLLKQPQPLASQHWQRVHQRSRPGSIGHRYAEEVLKAKGLLQEREPGQDDEETAVHF